MKGLVLVLVACCLFLVPAKKSRGHQLSPCYRVLTYDGNEPRQEPVRFLGNFCGLVLSPMERAAVHEHMTAASIREYRFGTPTSGLPAGWKWEYMVDPWGHETRSHRSLALIFGTWWNDDPLMLTLGQGSDFSSGGYRIWRSLKGNKSEYPPACLDQKRMVPAEQHLGRASHLGNMQHLHFMTSEATHDPRGRDRRVELTIQKALNWMEFAYRVATGAYAPELPFGRDMQENLGLPSIAKNFCVSDDKKVKVRTLFADLGQTLETRGRRTPDVALGSMLHILQDSFSPSHACRVGRDIDGKRWALLRDVENYQVQLEVDKYAHALLDKHPRWLLDYLKSGKRTYENDPVVVGAWLIAAVDHGLPWEEVEAHLRKTIFASVAAEDGSSREACIETAGAAGKKSALVSAR